MKKLIVWDCDETLWEGTLIHGDNPVLPEGRLELCEELFNRGVVQSVASHNLLSDVEQHIHRLGLTNFILLPQAEFGAPKSEMIKTIMEELGLAKESDVVFVDDNLHNLREVSYALPDVITTVPDGILDTVTKYFTKCNYTEEDRNRVRMYRSELARKKSGKAYGDRSIDFLRSLGLEMTIFRPSDANMPRVIDLVERANRLSAASEEFTAEKLWDVCDSLYAIKVADNFGDYGLSGVIAEINGVISLFVISCRLQGKGLGSALLGSVINRHPEATIALCLYHHQN